MQACQHLGALSDPNNEVNIAFDLVAVAIVDPAGGLEGSNDERVFFWPGCAGFLRGYHFGHKSRVCGLHCESINARRYYSCLYIVSHRLP